LSWPVQEKDFNSLFLTSLNNHLSVSFFMWSW
jgi:hypothetical protein